MIEYPEVAQLVDQLPTAEKARLIEHLSAALQRELEAAPQQRESWHEFLQSIYGSLPRHAASALGSGRVEQFCVMR